ncbi:MAG: arginine--tRNA ligase [Elusimicrobia bacterium]|nr:arginine--tRNA ligase [Elusimicrobiota bacterium]
MKKVIKKELDNLFSKWLKENNFGALPNYTLYEPPKNISCDLASNIAIVIAKQSGKNPKEIAEIFASLISSSLKKYIDALTIAGPGFLNITLSENILFETLKKLIKEKDKFGRKEYIDDKKILIEFVSANPTGPLHIGHGRGAAIGDSLARIFSFFGYDVEKEYYLNDVGNQIEMLGKSLEIRYRQLKGEPLDFPEDGYKGDYIVNIAKKLISSDSKEINFKKIALKEMVSTIKNDLSDFDVTFDSWFSESSIAPDGSGKKSKVEELCVWLKKNNYAYEKDGALWFASSKYGDDKDRVLKRSDERFTYLASDIAYHKNKIERGYDKLINLWGADHHGYVNRMKAAIQALGGNESKLSIILYQLVSLVRNGVPVAMSTRAGEFVTLEEVIKEVGKDACKFFFMMRAPNSQLEFDLELAKKKTSENPVFYVQYVHARCNSIFLEANKIKGFELASDSDFLKADFSLLRSKEEKDLIKKLIFFPDVIEACIENLTPHLITTYLMETSDIFHRFYENCRVLNIDDKELSLARLSLVKAVSEIIKNGLALLGVSAPEKM